MTDSLLTAQQVAEALNIRPSTVYALCRRRELVYVRLSQGKRRALIRFRAEDIEKVLRERTVQVK
jgi:excisionase family DNA binding protein